MGVNVQVLPDAGAPQVGVTVTGLGSGTSTVTVERSWDAGATWHGVRGAEQEQVVGGSAFFRDHVPPLNVATVYRVSGAVMAPDVAYSWSGAANASASVAKDPSGGTLRTNYALNPRATSLTNWSHYFSVSNGMTRALVTGASDGPAVGGVQIGSYIRHTVAAAGSASGFVRALGADGVGPFPTVGTYFPVRVFVRPSRTMGFAPRIWRTVGGVEDSIYGTNVSCPAGQWTELGEAVASVLTTNGSQVTKVHSGLVWNTTAFTANDTIDVTCILLDAVVSATTPAVPAYFDGDTPAVPATTQTTITIPSDTAWIQDPLDPRTAIPLVPRQHPGALSLLSVSAAEILRRQQISLTTPQGARLPVASVGTRQGPSGVAMTLRALAASQGVLIKRLRTLFDQAGQVVIRGLPDHLGLDPVLHVVVPDLSERPVTGGQVGLWNDWELTATQARPSSLRLLVPWWTYDQVKALWAATASSTYGAVKAARPGATYIDWLRDPTVP